MCEIEIRLFEDTKLESNYDCLSWNIISFYHQSDQVNYCNGTEKEGNIEEGKTKLINSPQDI